MDARPRRSPGRLDARLVLLSMLASAAVPAPATSQEFQRGRHVPGVRVGVVAEPYDVTGSTAVEILRQLMGRASPTGYPLWFTWSYEDAVVPLTSGIRSQSCRFTDFELVLDFTAAYPRWDPHPDADPELREAWSAFQREIERQWEVQRDAYLGRATEAVRLARRHEDACALLVQRFHDVLAEVLDLSRPLNGRPTPEPIGLAWPPAGFGHLLAADAAADAPTAPPPVEPPEAPSSLEARGPALSVRPACPTRSPGPRRAWTSRSGRSSREPCPRASSPGCTTTVRSHT